MDLDINVKAGTKVIVTEATKSSGWPSDVRNVERLLTINTPYTIERMEVHSWHTRVYLEGFPGVYFNSVNFEQV